jgi:hypothetical protein
LSIPFYLKKSFLHRKIFSQEGFKKNCKFLETTAAGNQRK